VTTAYTQW